MLGFEPATCRFGRFYKGGYNQKKIWSKNFSIMVRVLLYFLVEIVKIYKAYTRARTPDLWIRNPLPRPLGHGDSL